MRTTLRIDDHLLRLAKEHALRHGKTLTALMEDALRAVIGSKARPLERKRVKLPSFGSGGVLPGVDIASTASLNDIMDGIR